MKITRIECLNHVGMSATLPIVDGVTTLTGGNASGKTTLTNIVPGILFNELVLKKGETVGFAWEAESGAGSMLLNKDQKTLWRGTVDGASKEHNTIRAALKWMRENFPVSQSVFTTANYLAAFRSGTFLGGKPAERMALLSDIVGLHVFEDLRKTFSKMAQGTNVTLAVRSRILNDLQELTSIATTTKPVLDLGGVTNYLSERRSNIRAEAMKLSDALEDRPYGGVSTKDLKAILAIAPERNKAWDAWDEFQEAGGLPAKPPKFASYKAAMAMRDIDGMGLTRLITGEVKTVDNVAKHQQNLSAALAEVDAISKQLEHLEDHDGKTCPTCNSKVDVPTLVSALARTRKTTLKRVPDLRAKLTLAQNTQKVRDTVKRHDTTIDLLPALISTFDDIIEAYEAAQAVQARWGGEVPTKPTKARIDVEEVSAELRLRKRGYGKVEEDERRYDKLTRKFEGATSVLSAVNAIVEEQSEIHINRKRMQRLQSELSELRSTDDAELVVEILKALDNKNARNKYLDLVAEHWINELNELAPKFFDYKMEFDWTNGKLIANRKGGASDTVLLSGREGRAFLLLNAVAIQRCLPPSKRLRTLFLDEIEAGSEPKNRALLAEIIPSLLDHYDNIVVVTPLAKSEFYVDGPRYRVTKDKTIIREE